MYQQEISIEDCCRKGSQFAYTERNYTRSEIYFFTLFSSGVECLPCSVNCSQMKCGPQKKCAIRNGRPKCICSIMCKSSKVNRKTKLSSIITSNRGTRSLSSEIFINTFNQRRLTKTTFNWKIGSNKSSRGISSKVKRTLSTSTIITAHIFDTTLKPKNNDNFKIGNKKHRHHDQIFHQMRKPKNKLNYKERAYRIKNNFLFHNQTNIFNKINNHSSSNSLEQDSNVIPSFSSLRKLKQYQQEMHAKNDEQSDLHSQFEKSNQRFNIQQQQQKQQNQQPPENLKIDNTFLEHEPGSYQENNLWVSSFLFSLCLEFFFLLFVYISSVCYGLYTIHLLP